jgi:hypothetical protein
MASALRQAGVVLKFNPPGVEIDPERYEADLKPPILARREKYWKPDSKRAQSKCRQEFRMLVKAIPKVF